MKIRQLATAIVFCLAAVPASAQLPSESDRREALDHYRLGQDLLEGERYEQALREFGTALAKDRLLTVAHYGVGEANMHLRRYRSAIQAFMNCRLAFRELFDLQQRDRFNVERRRDEEIRELRDTARRLAGQSGTNLRIIRVENRVAELERQRGTNADGFVSPPAVSLALGSAYFRDGQLVAAEREWKAAIATDPRMGEAHNNLAALYAMTGRKAEAEVSAAAAQASGYAVSPQLKADISDLGRFAAPVDVPVNDIVVEALIPTVGLERLPQEVVAPAVTATRQGALDQFQAGMQRMGTGAFDQAAAAFLRSIMQDRTLAMAYYGLGHAYLARARFQDAISAYVQCLEILRREGTDAVRQVEPDIWLALGSAQFLASRLRDAEASWQKSVGLRTDFGEAWNNLAALYAQTHVKSRAVEALTAARRSGIATDPRLVAQIDALK
jgi:tetratricopeptide (TPR) repeat protein